MYFRLDKIGGKNRVERKTICPAVGENAAEKKGFRHRPLAAEPVTYIKDASHGKESDPLPPIAKR